MADWLDRYPLYPPDPDWWKRRLPGTIRQRILLVALLALAPLLLLGLGNAFLRVFTVGNVALRANRQQAQAIDTALASYLQDIRRQEIVIATAIGTRGQPNWGWTNNLLATVANENPSLRNLSWISPQGRILASSAPLAVGTDISGNASIRQVITGRTWVVSDLQSTGPITRAVSLVIAYASRTDIGQLRGIVVAEINPDNLSDVLLGDQYANAVTAVFDRQGRLIVSSPPRQGSWRQRAAWRGSDRLLRRAAATDRETRGAVKPATFDTSHYAVYEPAAGGYIVGALRPRAAMRAPIWGLALLRLLLLLLITALVALSAYRISGTIVDPAQTLQGDVERLGLQERVPPLHEVAPVEFRELHAAIAAMATMLIQRNQTCDTERDRLATILERMPAGVRYVNANGEVLLANPIARELLGEDALGVAMTPRGRYTLHRLDGTPLSMTEIPLVCVLHGGRECRNMELAIRYEDGSGIIALFSATPVPDAQGATTGVIEVVVKVVSEVVNMQEIMVSTNLEQQLATARGQLEALLDILPVGVLLLNAHGQIIRVNAESTRLWGGTIPVVNSLNDFRFLYGWHTRSGEPLQQDDWPPVRALTHNETVINDTITLNRFDGLRGDVFTSAAPLHNAQGAVSGAVWVVQDRGMPK